MDIGTSKENMVALRWPAFSGFYWRGGRGEEVLCFYEDWLSRRVSLVGQRGRELSSVAVFSSNQKPSFPSQANLEKTCPT